MRNLTRVTAFALAIGLFVSPRTASADDPADPTYDITAFPAHGVTVEEHDCAGGPAIQGATPYRFVWDPGYRQDILELSAHAGTTSVGIDVPDTSAFNFWEFGNQDIGTAEVVVNLGADNVIRGTGDLSYDPQRGGEWFIGKDTVLDWTQYDAGNPSGLHLGTASLAGLPAGYAGPARISLVLTDCSGPATGTTLRLGTWWLDAGPGAQWIANFESYEKPTIASSVSRTAVMRGHTIRLSAAVSDLPSGEPAYLELWHTVKWTSDKSYDHFSLPTWQRLRRIPLPASGRATMTVTPTENTRFQWQVVPTGIGIDDAQTAPVAVTVTPRMTLKLNHRVVRLNHAVTVSGHVDGHENGRVTLYRLVRSRLVKIATARGVGVAGDYSFAFRPHRKGTWKLVTAKTGTTEFAAGTSPTVSLRVR